LQFGHRQQTSSLPTAVLQGSKVVEDEGRYRVHIPGTGRYVGDVETRITDDGRTIENRTKEGHIFFDGVVVRTLTQSEDGAWYVTTHGSGIMFSRAPTS